MELILFATIIMFLIGGTIIYLFFPEKYLKYREKEVNTRDIELLRFQGVLLFIGVLFFIVMFVKSL